MQSAGLWSLNYDLITSLFGLNLTSILQKSHPQLHSRWKSVSVHLHSWRCNKQAGLLIRSEGVCLKFIHALAMEK